MKKNCQLFKISFFYYYFSLLVYLVMNSLVYGPKCLGLDLGLKGSILDINLLV